MYAPKYFYISLSTVDQKVLSNMQKCRERGINLVGRAISLICSVALVVSIDLICVTASLCLHP